jgi:hypothetical protein
MLESPFTFFRGSAVVMAADLGTTPTIGVNIQACGDAHSQNFGIYATPERRLIFDVNDFDETLPAPWEYDLKRLAASLVLDARDAGWGDGFGRDLVVAAVHGYQDVLRRLSGLSTLEIQYAMMNERRFFAADLDPMPTTRPHSETTGVMSSNNSASSTWPARWSVSAASVFARTSS